MGGRRWFQGSPRCPHRRLLLTGRGTNKTQSKTNEKRNWNALLPHGRSRRHGFSSALINSGAGFVSYPEKTIPDSYFPQINEFQMNFK